MIRQLLRAGLLTALMLAGCAAPPPPERRAETEVTPLPLRLQPVYDRMAGVALAQALVEHYLHGPHYRMSTPLLLAQQYRALNAQPTPDPQRLLVAYRDGERWGSVAVSVGRDSLVNAFRVRHRDEEGYALVLRRVRICLNTGADRAPQWQGSRWQFSPQQPGRFECSGQTNGSLFQPGSGLPGLLGPYVEAGDSVLYARDRASLHQLASLLAHQFPHLRVPHVQ